MLKDQLGDWLEWQRRNHKHWLRILYVILALLVVVNIFVHPAIGGHGGGHGEAVESHGEAAGHGEAVEAEGHGEAMEAEAHGEALEAEGHGAAQGEESTFFTVDHPHFVIDSYPGFWAAFGLGVAVIMTLVLKKFVFLLIGKAEDYYERNERY